MAGRIPRDLRRSGVKDYIEAGVDPHTVMQWSGHRTQAMRRRYHVIDLDDLRRAGRKASEYPRRHVERQTDWANRSRTAPGERKFKRRRAGRGLGGGVQTAENRRSGAEEGRTPDLLNAIRFPTGHSRPQLAIAYHSN